MKRRRGFLVTLGLSLALGAAAPLARSDTGSSGVEVLERWTLDARFRLRGPRAPHPELALVVFDDATAERAGPLFERRAGWAKVIDAIAAQQPAAIGVDAVFDVPERLLGPELQQRVGAWRAEHEPAGAATTALLEDVARELDGDLLLAEALRRAGNVALIVSEGTANVEKATLGKARYAQSTPSEGAPPVQGLVASRPELNAASRGLGLATVAEDATRTVRSQFFARTDEHGVYMPLVVPLVALARGVGRGQLAYLGPSQEVHLGELVVPLSRDRLWVDFAGPERTVPTWSVLDLMEGRVEALRGKIVLLGVTRFGYDRVRTPFGSVPGVELQATLADNVLRGRSLRRTEPLTDALLVAGLAALVGALFSGRRSLRFQLSLGGALVVGWLVTAHLALASRTLWLPVVTPVAAMALSLFAGLATSYAAEALQRQQLKKAFGHYVGGDVLEELLQHPQKLALGGERRTLTVFFSDIRDFTTLSERLSPTELVAFLNTYLSPMTRAVLREGGLLDKYIGDAVMAVFGAPVPRADHAAQALRCVAQMHEELAALNAGPLRRFGLEIAIGVGVNTGDMVVGNMGSEERFDYTVAGDAVNLASRLEGLSKTYGVFCLVGATTRDAVAADAGFTFRELDLVQVKGKQEAVAVYELLSVAGRVLAQRAELAAWTAGLAAFRAGRLPEARSQFSAFAAANPGELAVQRYLARLAELPAEAPADFSAVSAFKTK